MLNPDPSRLLVVDDDPATLDLLVTRLSLAGYPTFYARDGYDGLRRFAEVRPALVILDINMPRLDGFGVLRGLAKTGALARTPVMVLTGRTDPDDVRTAIGLGARDFLTKPFESDLLLARVARLLRGRNQPLLTIPPPPAPTPAVDDSDDVFLI